MAVYPIQEHIERLANQRMVDTEATLAVLDQTEIEQNPDPRWILAIRLSVMTAEHRNDPEALNLYATLDEVISLVLEPGGEMIITDKTHPDASQTDTQLHKILQGISQSSPERDVKTVMAAVEIIRGVWQRLELPMPEKEVGQRIVRRDSPIESVASAIMAESEQRNF